MSEVKDGGPAFPRTPGTTGGPLRDGAEGMTLRDYFAAKAMQGMLGGAPGSHLIFGNAAQEAYAYADAMLKERAK